MWILQVILSIKYIYKMYTKNELEAKAMAIVIASRSWRQSDAVELYDELIEILNEKGEMTARDNEWDIVTINRYRKSSPDLNAEGIRNANDLIVYTQRWTTEVGNNANFIELTKEGIVINAHCYEIDAVTGKKIVK